MTSTTTFGERVRHAIADHGRLCVGIDPHESLLVEWGLPVSAAGVREFGLRVVDAAAGRIGVVKPQVSFFERFGSAGFAALEEVMAQARAAGLLVIADAKRGDIGTTMDAYARAWLEPGSPLEADALTVSPYLGVGAVRGTIDLALSVGKGVFVLAATSNPEAAGLQTALLAAPAVGAPVTVAAGIVADVSAINASATAEGEWGSIGFVIGATIDWPERGLRAFAPPAPILAPGFGAQGARPSDLVRFGEHAGTVLASESRSVLSAGPAGLTTRIIERASDYAGVDV